MFNKQLSKKGARQLLSFLIDDKLPVHNHSNQVEVEMFCSPVALDTAPRSPQPNTTGSKMNRGISLDITPSKKQRHNSLQKASIRDSGKDKCLIIF